MAFVTIKGFGRSKKLNESGGVQEAAEIITDAISKGIDERTVTLSHETGTKLAKDISTHANQKLRGLFPFIADKLFGRFPGATDKNLTAFHFDIRGQAGDFGLKDRAAVNVTWTALQKKYLEGKAKKGNPNFFRLTGELQSHFASMSNESQVWSKLGGINASYVPGQKVERDFRARAKTPSEYRQEMGTVEVWLLPSRSISPSRFGQTITEGQVANSRELLKPSNSKQLDRVLFSDREDILAKLINKGKPRRDKGRFAGRAYRPVMQPAISVWLLQRIPQAVAEVFRRFAKS